MRMEILNVTESRLTGKKCVELRCPACGKKEKVYFGNLSSVKDYKCGYCNGLDSEESEIPWYERESTRVKRDTRVNRERSSYNYSRRLEVMYERLLKKYSDCWELGDKEEFMSWALKNGYRPWRVFKKKDGSLPATKDNCEWVSGSYGCSGDKIGKNEYDTMRKLEYHIEEAIEAMDKAMQACGVGSKDSEPLVRLKEKLSEGIGDCYEILRRTPTEMEEIWLNSTERYS